MHIQKIEKNYFISLIKSSYINERKEKVQVLIPDLLLGIDNTRSYLEGSNNYDLGHKN